MTIRSTIFAACCVGCAVGVGCVVAAGCDREHRKFRDEDPSMTNVTGDVQMNGVIAGLPPTLSQETTPPTRPDANNYERNVFQLSEGQRLYVSFNCVGCHANGGGDIGPPLADNTWLYGARPDQVYESIVQGRPNGMPAFGRRLTQTQTWQLVAYVRSMSGMVPRTVAPSRSDHMQTLPPPNSTPMPTTVRTMPNPLPGTTEPTR